jgi:methylenetetrahydrofolate dehydrogenase (NADP+)/methenyltetrahydrofolate cyclohydrolase
MIIDGRALARRRYQEMRHRIATLPAAPHLTIFTCAPNFETQRYLALKRRKAADVGIHVSVIELPEGITTDEVVQTVTRAQMQTDGIIVQLPLPRHLDTPAILNAIPVRYDVDGVHYDGTSATVLPPVVAAIAHIAEEHDLLLASSQVVVVGQGRLVGLPAATWARRQGAHVTVLTKEHGPDELRAVVAHAHVLMLGAGQPHLITPDMVRPGVVIFDAGTSEEHGELRGDADPACAEVASLFTPVPGGIGPLTVAFLLENVVSAATRQ